MKFEFQSDFCNFVENSVDMGKDKITTDSCQMVLQSFGQGVLCMDESVQ